MGFRVIEPLQTNVLQSIALGISTDSLQPNYLTIDQTKENVKNLLLTRKGERVIHVNFGSDLLKIVFEPNVSELKDDIVKVITDPINFWLPYVNIDAIDIVTAEDDPTSPYNLKITLTFSVNEFDTSTIIFKTDNFGQIEIE